MNNITMKYGVRPPFEGPPTKFDVVQCSRCKGSGEEPAPPNFGGCPCCINCRHHFFSKTVSESENVIKCNKYPLAAIDDRTHCGCYERRE